MPNLRFVWNLWLNLQKVSNCHFRLSMDENKNIKVYRASAGSGKTFTLVSEYIALAISSHAGSSAFAGILAITFTNKATGEMKMRILNTLWNIGNGLPQGNAYVGKIGGILGGKFSAEEIRERCATTLRHILNNYDFFDVKTIDSFFQGIVGDIAAMIGYDSSLEVFLNDDEAVDSAVENIVAQAAEGKNRVLAGLLKDYIEKNLEENSSWDFRRALKRFGLNVCREAYMRNEAEINRVYGDTRAFSEIYDRLAGEKKKAENLISHLADSLTIDYGKFAKGKYVRNYVAKAVKCECDGMNKSVSAFYNGDYGKAEASPEEMDVWHSQFVAFEKDRARLFRRLNSADLTLKNLNEMRMLEAIDSEVKKESRDENRILLSKSQELVSEQLRDGENISFVFERAGRRYRHVMLDEAQDTSQMQFDSLWKLMSNLLAAEGNRCVVVGDVKQSIYRWRGGDWNILQGLGEKYDAEGRYVLGDNYRSCGNIVAFNNEFFECVRKLRPDDIGRIYSDVRQCAKHGPAAEGCVRIFGIPSDGGDVEEERLETLLGNIELAHDAGVDYSEMAILTRKNDEIYAIADYARSNDAPFRIDTREAYNLTNSVAVEIVIAAMKYVYGEVCGSPDNVCGFFVAREYRRTCDGAAFAEPVFEDANEDAVRGYMEKSLPPKLAKAKSSLAELPVAEMAMRLARMLRVSDIKGESQYLLTFMDYMNAYSQRNAYDLKRFFDDWDAEGAKQYIDMGADNGIKAMTIHKAKGLEFHTVFIPYCDWKFVPTNSSKMWCSPHGEGYDGIPLVPVGFVKKAKESIYEVDYAKEVFDVEVDNLNMLYVAFTRAKANLFVQYAERDIKGGTINSTRISDFLVHALGNMDMEKYGKDIVPGEKAAKNGGSRFSTQGRVVELDMKMEELA